VEFQWDTRKAESNLRKHGVSFSFAMKVFQDSNRLERLEDSEDYGETRWVVIGLAGQILVTAIYVWRGDDIRFISVRKADRDETEAYWKNR
jgi:uncharacterized DUF497 family protein